jgi:hypothetical protein
MYSACVDRPLTPLPHSEGDLTQDAHTQSHTDSAALDQVHGADERSRVRLSASR